MSQVFTGRLVAVILLGFCAFSRLHAEGRDSFDFNSVLVHHLMDAPVVEWNVGGAKVRPGDPLYQEDPKILTILNMRRYVFKDATGLYKWQGGIPLHITKRVAMMFVVSVILLLVLIAAARVIAADPLRIRGHFSGLVEVMVQFIRKDVVDQNMHGHGAGFQPYILSLFFFILFHNLFGLIPPLGEIANEVRIALSGAGHVHHGPGENVGLIVGIWSGITVTGDVAVTASLAIITTGMVWITGFRYQGISFLWSFMPKGFPPAMAIILYPILFPLLFILEIVVGPIAKGFALTIRLLANMTAGHVIILALLGFIFQFGLAVAPISVLGASLIYLLEIFVAFLQAFIFALLTSIFIGSVMHAH